jgi:hypothetical protein
VNVEVLYQFMHKGSFLFSYGITVVGSWSQFGPNIVPTMDYSPYLLIFVVMPVVKKQNSIQYF